MAIKNNSFDSVDFACAQLMDHGGTIGARDIRYIIIHGIEAAVIKIKNKAFFPRRGVDFKANKTSQSIKKEKIKITDSD